MEELEEFAFAGCPDVMAPKEGNSCTSCVSHQVGYGTILPSIVIETTQALLIITSSLNLVVEDPKTSSKFALI